MPVIGHFRPSAAAVRLSVFWFLFLGGMGIFFPYFADHLSISLGFTKSQVGMVLAMVPLAGIAGQPLWGQVSDRTGSRRLALCVLCVIAAGAVLLVARLESFWPVLLGTAFLAFHMTAVLPLLTAASMATLRADGQKSFARVRFWGTLGFLVGAIGTPRLFGGMTESGRAEVSTAMFYALAVVFAVCAATALLLPAAGDVTLRARRGTGRQLLAHTPIRRILLFAFIAFVVLQGPILNFPVILRDRGGDVESIAQTWLGMLIIELPLVFLAGVFLRWFGPRGLLAVGIGVEGLRWIATAMTGDLTVLQSIQLVHGVGVTGILLGIPFYLEACVPRDLRSTGQALASVAGVGLGGMVSSMTFGHAAEAYGVDAPLLAFGILGVLLAATTALILPPPHRIEIDEES